jgi:hypothetical protein
MYKITFLHPYTQHWLFQSFPTKEEAERMIAFYKSCGSPARFA